MQVRSELSGLQGLDLQNESLLQAPTLWLELYTRLLWQGSLRRGRSDVTSSASTSTTTSHMHTQSPYSRAPTRLFIHEGLVRCRPREYGELHAHNMHITCTYVYIRTRGGHYISFLDGSGDGNGRGRRHGGCA